MAQRKQSFRFRIPWRISSGAPEPLSRRPKDTSKSPTQLDTNVPIQPPSSPSVITPAESPPSPSKTQEAPRTEPQNHSPPHPTQPTSSPVIIQSPVTTIQSKPPSPPPSLQPSSHADASSPSHVNIVSSTQPQSPSHLASDSAMKVLKPSAEESTHPAPPASQQEKEKVVVSEPMPQEAEPEMKVKSPLRAITKSPETSFQPERLSSQPADSEQQPSSMPSSSPVSKTEPAASQPHPLASELTKELKTNPEESTLPASSTSQEEKEKMAVAVPEPMPQEAEPKMKSPLKIIPKSPEPSSQPENLSTQPKATLEDEERSISTKPKAPLETQSKFLQPEEKERVVHKTKKAGKAKDTTYSQPTLASTSGTKAKDPSAKGVCSDKKHGARETVERKIMFATSNSSGKDFRVMSSTDPGTRNVSSISPEKTVSSSEEKTPLQKGIKDDITKFVHKLTSVHQTQPMDDKQFSVITLAGDNRGATMHVGSDSAKKEGSIHIHRAYKTDPEESTEVTTDVEENTDTNDDSHRSMEQDEVGKAYVNSNIQSINNSLMVHGSITERDPGVQVTLPQNPPESIKPDDKGIHKTEFNISRAKRPTYQPTVRRRSLRGLFQEPIDPDKPHHHGCKFSYDKDIEDIEIL